MEIAEKVLTLIYLGINAGNDVKKKQIVLWTVFLYSAAAIIVSVFLHKEWANILTAFVCILGTGGFSLLTGNAFGMGDALILTSLGLMIGRGELIAIAGTALLLAGVWCAILIMMKRAGRKTEIPFIPFLLFSYVGGICLW